MASLFPLKPLWLFRFRPSSESDLFRIFGGILTVTPFLDSLDEYMCPIGTKVASLKVASLLGVILKQRLLMETSHFHDPFHPSDPVVSMGDKKIHEKQKDEPSKSLITLTLEGHTLSIKECTFYTLQQEKDEHGTFRFKIKSYNGERTEGEIPPLILVCGGHVFYSKEHATALDEAILTEQNLNHPILQIYRERDPFSGETCWHALDASALHSFSHKIHSSSNISSSHDEPIIHRSHAKPHKPSPYRRAPHSQEEQEIKAPKADEPGAAERILETNPGSVDSVALEAAEWIDKKRIESSDAKLEAQEEFLHQADLGQFDELMPLYKNSLSALTQDEKEEEKKSKPPSSLSEKDKKQIENMRSHFPI